MSRDERAEFAKMALGLFRRGQGTGQPAEIAQIAQYAGLSRPDILREVQSISQGRGRESGEVVAALSELLLTILVSRHGKDILEYTSAINPLTAELAQCENWSSLTYVAPDLDVLKTLEIVFEETNVQVVREIDEVPNGTSFSTIICRSPLGLRPRGSNYDADGFGGEVVQALSSHLVPGGLLIWITGREVLSASRPRKTFSALALKGFTPVATIDVGVGWSPTTMIEGVVVLLSVEGGAQRLLGTLRDPDAIPEITREVLTGPTRKAGANWLWVAPEGPRTFTDLEQQRLIQKLMPRGPFDRMPFSRLLTDPKIERADRLPKAESQYATQIFIPQYAERRVTVDLAEQTVKLGAVYRLQIDQDRANPSFLVQLLNGPYGIALRTSVARGATIPQISAYSLRSLELPIPSVELQNQIARLSSDIKIIATALSELEESLGRNWRDVSEISLQIEKAKAVFDVEKRIEDWSTELPYPLATIYRRYQVSNDPKERAGTLLHFFEMAAVYFATIGVSYVRVLAQDWQQLLSKWLHPSNAAGIGRADFGFWIGLAAVSLKETRRICSDDKLRQIANENAGLDLVSSASNLGKLNKVIELLQTARKYRNDWVGHGGHLKTSDAARLDDHLQQSVRSLFEVCAPLFRRFHLVRPGRAQGTDTGMRFEVERLSGSDPAFRKINIELDGHVKTGALAFWMDGARSVCRAIHFFRLGAPQEPEEKSIYVFSRVESAGFRWISYQEAREQELIAPDDELKAIVELGKTIA